MGNETTCIFCQMVNKQIKPDIVYETEEVLAFRDINPQAPVHILVIPKVHISSLFDLNESTATLLGKLYGVINQVAKQEKVHQTGFRVVVNCGADAGQAVDHLHFHVLGKRRLAWPPG